MLGTRNVLLAGAATLGLAVSLPALSCGDKEAKAAAGIQPAAMVAGAACGSKTDAAKVQPVALQTASADACCPGKGDAAKVQAASVKSASAGACEKAPAAAPASFAVRSQAAMTQAAKSGSLVMAAVYTTADNRADAKTCTAGVKPAGAKACPEGAGLQAASVKTASADGCPLTAAKVASAGKAECETVKATQARFVTLQVNPNDCPGSKAFAAKHNVKTFPTTLFLDAKGKEVHRVAGELKDETLTAAMDAALAKSGEKLAARG